MLPIYIKNINTGEIIHINPEENPQEWRRAIQHEFSALEVDFMRAYPNNFHYMLDALRRSVNCKPGNHFLLFDRKDQTFDQTVDQTLDQTLDQSIVYEIVSCSEDRLVCKPVEGGEEITFEGDDLHYHMMFFIKYEGEMEK